ncbi:type I-E CRISPR-associated protein Cas7/Cse4/CasC [Nocardia brasiliensis]|uniref:type I-E CRISPR-associated protein Cas7/Cse4/CasC n=1 Tax=Nocardia brasiliensis TaxID=37326 RepID=UPI003D8DCE00
MNRTLIDLHILQTVPPSNLNRDDTGSPKSAIYGGVRRARVSSQAWKRATRVAFGDQFDRTELGVRTRRLVELLAAEITSRAPGLEQRARELAATVMNEIGIKVKPPKKNAVDESGYLVFLSRHQIDALAEAAVAAAASDDVVRALREAKVKDMADRAHSIDIALFGRMVADQADLNVDAAVQVAHAIGVHPIETEFDFFTAVDDHIGEGETGAAMIGTVEFNSATLYRYATIDVDRLADNLGDPESTCRAVRAFVNSFVRAMPTGKQNAFANRTLPEAVVALVRDSQPINLVAAFERPVRESETGGRIPRAAAALRDEAMEIQRAYNELPVAAWVTRLGAGTAALDDLGDHVSFADLVDRLAALVEARLSERR